MNIQMILALGAMILLTLIIITTNKNSLYTEDVMYNSNFGITATSIALSVIEDANKKRFDEVFYEGDSAVTNVTNFTAPNLLGVDAGEDATNPLTFNDFDDYKNYTSVDSSMPTAIFNFKCDVNYVDALNPDTPINTQSWNKKITVKVWSISMQDTITMSSIFSYWRE
ncbi:MAG: hypothetical protein ACM3O3_07565 [Syntrophothermus sp.]